nr:hypothetical protein [Bartonella rattimassiliensis]
MYESAHIFDNARVYGKAV